MISTLLVVTTLLFVRCYAAPQVQVGETTLIGKDDPGLKQEFFGKLPYAEPPLGNMRLKPSVLKTDFGGGTFDATNYGPACLKRNGPGSEDCLTLNILRPSNLSPNAKLPVVFWVYGGGFQDGSASAYNGSPIVARSVERGTPVIFVNFNYRLGALGFPVGQEANAQSVLNLGFGDTLTALKWVQNNIEAFGGDKQKVTLVGQSAGAVIISSLYLNSHLEQLAHGAILESGSQASSVNFSPEARQTNWENFVSAVPSCASKAKSGQTLDCLRSASSNDILTGILNSRTTGMYPFGPTIDGAGGLYPDIPSKLLSEGTFAKIPFISGTNLDEGTIFVDSTIDSIEKISQLIRDDYTPSLPSVSPDQLSQATDKLLELYPQNSTNNDYFKYAARIVGDIAFDSQRRYWQQAAVKAGVNTWGYLLTQPPKNPGINGVAHGSDLAYIFNRSPSSPSLSLTMIDYWVSFATSLNPNDGKGQQRPVWEQYTLQSEKIIQLNNEPTMISDTYRESQIDYINSIPAVFLHRRDLENARMRKVRRREYQTPDGTA